MYGELRIKLVKYIQVILRVLENPWPALALSGGSHSVLQPSNPELIQIPMRRKLSPK
jgi:hypothetical protein